MGERVKRGDRVAIWMWIVVYLKDTVFSYLTSHDTHGLARTQDLV